MIESEKKDPVFINRVFLFTFIIQRFTLVFIIDQSSLFYTISLRQ